MVTALGAARGGIAGQSYRCTFVRQDICSVGVNECSSLAAKLTAPAAVFLTRLGRLPAGGARARATVLINLATGETRLSGGGATVGGKDKRAIRAPCTIDARRSCRVAPLPMPDVAS